MKMSVIIPTRNRPDELVQCIRQIAQQSTIPDEIIVVGHISDLDTEKKLSIENESCMIRFIKSAGGTCHARNAGIHNANGDIVVFIDDDVVLDLDYFKNIFEVFKDSNINIVTGYTFDLIDLQSPTLSKERDILFLLRHEIFSEIVGDNIAIDAAIRSSTYLRLKKWFIHQIRILFLLESNNKGRILQSGYRSEMPNFNDRVQQKVEWVFGNNFAARNLVLNNFLFNTELEKVPYALNEDLEFSARVGKKYQIMLDSNVTLLHVRSPKGNRISGKERGYSMVMSMAYVAKERGNQVAWCWSIIGLLLSAAFSSIANGASKDLIKGVYRGFLDSRNLIWNKRYLDGS